MDSGSDDPFRGPHERGVWSQDEHDKFLAAVALHPHGPWKTIAALVGTRSVRQVQTHAQKYHEKVHRRARGLQKNRQKVARQEHRVDEAALDFLARPRGGKGHKRGKYNKRRVAPVPPSRGRSAPRSEPTVTPPSPTAVETTTTPVAVGAIEPEPRIPSDVATAPSPPRSDLLLEAAELFPLTDDDSRPSTPLVLASPAPDTVEAFPAEAIDTMFDDDDIVAVEEAPEHALSVGAVPSLNDALDYFLQVMTAWGPSQVPGGGSPMRGSVMR